MNTIPPTAWLLTRHGIVVGHYNSRLEAVYANFRLGIDAKGAVHLDGKPQSPQYVLDPDSSSVVGSHWAPDEAIKDWIYHHLKLPREYRLYRYLL